MALVEPEADRLARFRVEVALALNDQLSGRRFDVEDGRIAEVLDDRDRAGEGRGRIASDRRPSDAQAARRVRPNARRRRLAMPISTVRPPGRTTLAVRPLIAAMSTGKKFMLGEPMKAATNLLAGAL